MATKITRADTTTQFVASGLAAALIIVVADRAAWLLWVVIPTAIIGVVLFVRTPQTPFREAQRAVQAARGGRIGSGMNRRAGWNSLGTVVVHRDDPFLVLKGELPAEGVAIPMPPGRWHVHSRAELVAQGPTHMRDVEMRVVQDPRWVAEEWEWTANWEPMLPPQVGTTTQAGRVSTDGLLRLRGGRRGRTVVLQTGFSDGAYGVNVLRDLGGRVFAVVSRFG